MQPVTLPVFDEQRHFRRLTPAEGKRVYRFITTRHIRFPIPGIVPDRQAITFHDATGRQWLQLDRFGALVSEGYAWNGCTPKRWVPLLGWIGTPDYPATIPASLIHDAFYQFHATAHFPLHRSDCDAIFRDLTALGGEPDIARIYHAAVRRFGHWSATVENGEYSTLHR